MEGARGKRVIYAIDRKHLLKIKGIHHNCHTRTVGIAEHGHVGTESSRGRKHHSPLLDKVCKMLDQIKFGRVGVFPILDRYERILLPPPRTDTVGGKCHIPIDAGARAELEIMMHHFIYMIKILWNIFILIL